MSGPPQLRVAITDGMPLFRRGAVQALEERPSIEVVAQTAGGQAVLREILRTGPDVALLEVDVANTETADLLRGLARAESPTRVLLVSSVEDPAVVRDVLASGVSGCLSKRADEEELYNAILVAATGGTVISQGLQAGLLCELDARSDRDLKRLSLREEEVLRRVADGESSREIGEALKLSASTVKTYQRRLYEKLDVNTQAAAVAQGMRLGFID